jgi:Aerotolerance regulator N-terminal
MTFLAPLMLWGLPLLLVPVIIHLLNRLRHRPQQWAAMRFLLAATRRSTSNTKLRQFLILLCRTLMVAALVLFLARPLAGGWMGWAVASAPDAIVILLDRSASMETKSSGSSKRELAVRMLAQAANPFEGSSHIVVIDSATLSAQEIAHGATLAQLPGVLPTDTAADLPAMLRAAFNWLVENHAGTAEIWIASDGQRSNWHPDDPRWKDITTQLAALSQKVRVRVLALDQAPDANASVALREVTRRPHGGQSELDIVLDLQRNRASSAPMPITMTLDGTQTEAPVAFEGESLRWRHPINLGTHPKGGWGSFALPTDANAHDNTAYFVYGAETAARAVVVASSSEEAKYLRLAAASRNAQPAEIILPAAIANANLDGCSLILWQDALPQGEAAERLRTFASQGGVVMFFPPGGADATLFQGMGWGTVEDAHSAEGFHVARWDEEEGPLARSDEHLSLPLAQTTFARRQTISGQKNAEAAFVDGAALLARQNVGLGEIYFCAAQAVDNWSSLSDGPVLVPMLQRLLQDGTRRLQDVAIVSCGEVSAVDLAKEWLPVDSKEQKDIRFQAGVYKSGERVMAVNRPEAEDDPEVVDSSQMRKMFGDLPMQMFQDHEVATGKLEGEVWRLFLFSMLLLLLVEGMLILPSKARVPQAA